MLSQSHLQQHLDMLEAAQQTSSPGKMHAARQHATLQCFVPELQVSICIAVSVEPGYSSPHTQFSCMPGRICQLVRRTVLQALAEDLQQTLDDMALPDGAACSQLPATPAAVRQLLDYAHRLAYTTFAPPGHTAGQPLPPNFRPPAPQDWQMRASQLHSFSGLRALQRHLMCRSQMLQLVQGASRAA